MIHTFGYIYQTGLLHLRVDTINGFTRAEVAAEAAVALEEKGVASSGTLDDLGQVQCTSLASFKLFSFLLAQELEHNDNFDCDQCDQIGRFLTFKMTNIRAKFAQMLGNFLGFL